MLAVEPHCPKCDASGIECIEKTASVKEDFSIVHCSECGHVYGLLPGTPTSACRYKSGSAVVM